MAWEGRSTLEDEMRWYIDGLKKYGQFDGRARRREYWMFALFNMLIAFALAFVEGLFSGSDGQASSILVSFYQLAVLVPSVAVAVRRLHDTDHRGWWLLVPVFNLILVLREGQSGENRFGADPKAVATELRVAA
jgi:uncharacterized membrane protein YhaH (DUF805 family)